MAGIEPVEKPLTYFLCGSVRVLIFLGKEYENRLFDAAKCARDSFRVPIAEYFFRTLARVQTQEALGVNDK